MFGFFFPETGEPAIHNRLIDGPFADQQEAIDKFVARFQDEGFSQLPKHSSRDLAAFMNDRTGVIVVLRPVTAGSE